MWGERLVWIFLVIVLCALLMNKGCDGDQDEAVKKTQVSYKFDSTTYKANIIPVKPSSEVLELPGEWIHDTVFVAVPIDTGAVVTAYYTARFYERNFSDTNISIVFKDSVYQNTLTWSEINYRLLRPTTIITQTTIEPVVERNRLYVGLGTSAGFSGFPAAGPDILLTTKKGHGYRLGYHFGQNSSTVSASIFWRVGK